MLHLEIRDLSPKFLEFYDAAVKNNAKPNERWELWQRMYGFAAVPPTDEGKRMARRMLDQCWDNYPAVMERVRTGIAAISSPQGIIEKIVGLFDCKEDLSVKVVFFVGMMEGNAFTYAEPNGPLVVCLPMEQPLSEMEICMSHEFAHIVHMAASGLRMMWLRPTAVTILMEGIAMHTSRVLVPNHPTEAYTEFSDDAGWLQACEHQRGQILAGIQPFLADASSEVVEKFTIGNGSTGLHREAYFVGWIMVEHLMASGWSLADLARLDEVEIISLVESTLPQLMDDRGLRDGTQ